MNQTRRRFFMNSLFGAGWLGLRALATGLPIGLFAAPRRVTADPTGCASTSQYLVLVTSSSGDPLNANVPGTFENQTVYHPPSLTTGSMSFGGQSVTAASAWASIDPSVLARTSFLHHGTYTNAHGDAPKVNKLMGAVMRQEMLCSMLAANTGPCLGTVQTQPVVLNNNLITYTGAVLPVLSPPALQAVLAAPDTNNGPLTQMQKLRDSSLDQLNTIFKASGNTNGRAMLDQFALSQTQVRSISQQLLSDLSAITGSTPVDLAVATAVLFKMNVSPVVVLSLSFGGDNHTDVGLASEAANLAASTSALFSTTAATSFVNKLRGYTVGNTTTSLWDQTTIALQNVFGRTLNIAAHSNQADGRNHNADHHCTVLVGKNVKSSLVGGIVANTTATDFRATGINSTDGSANDSGDIPYEETLAAVGKTIGRAVGVDQTVLDTQITLGKTITAALA